MPEVDIPEFKRNTCLSIVINDFNLWERYASYSKLIRIMAYRLRFRPGKTRNGDPRVLLDASEIRRSEIRIVKLVQAVQFPEAIKDLKE